MNALVLAMCALAADPKLDIDAASLRDHDTIVIVANLGNDAATELAMRKETLQSYVIKKLSAAKLPAIEKLEKTRAAVVLTVEVDVLKVGRTRVFTLNMKGHQFVRLLHNGDVSFGTTWHRNRFGILSATPGDDVRDIVDEFCGDFIGAWNEAHKPATDPFAGEEKPKAKSKSQDPAPNHGPPGQPGRTR